MDLNSLIAEHETVADAPVDAAPVEADPAPVEVAPAATETVAPASDPLADYGLEPEDIQEVAQLVRQLREQANQPQQVEQQGPPEFDPFDPESVHAYNTYRDQKLLGQISQLMAPLVGAHQSEVMTEAENRAADILKDDQAQHGEFVGGEPVLNAARAYAETLLPQFQERYGFGPRAAEAALTASAQHFRQLEQSIGTAAVDRYKNEMSTLAGAPKDIGTGVAGTPVAGEYATEMDAAMAYMARNAT